MPSFIGRPRLFEDLHQQLQSADPTSAALQAISSIVKDLTSARMGKLKDDRDMANKEKLVESAAARQKALQVNRQSAALTSMLSKEGRLTPYQPQPQRFAQQPLGFQGFNLPGMPGQAPMTPVPGAGAGQASGVLLSELLGTFGGRLQSGSRDFTVGPKAVKPVANKASEFPLTAKVAADIKDFVDLTEFADQGYMIKASDLSGIRNRHKYWLSLGSKGPLSREDLLRKQAEALALKERTAMINQGHNPASLPDWRQQADEYYDYIVNQQAEEAKPGPLDGFVRELMSEMGGGE